MPPFVRRAENYKAFRIGSESAPYYACIIDPAEAQGGASLAAVVEIYPHRLPVRAGRLGSTEELLFVLKGKARAVCDGETRLVEPGDTIVVPAGREKVIENLGPGKLYALAVGGAPQAASEITENRVEVLLDQDDLGVLRRLPLRR